MRFLIITALMAFSFLNASAQGKVPAKFQTTVSFGSMCCGTASDDFLRAYYKKFVKANKVAIPTYKATGCGKEGEYRVMFNTSRLKQSVKNKFVKGLNTAVNAQEKKNRAADSSSGTINIEHDIATADISHCRGGIIRWEK